MASNLTNFEHACSNDDQGHGFSSINIMSGKLRFSLSITIIIYIIYLLPFCFGVFGNISVCLIFFQQKKLRSITNTFLMNLCLNDLIVLCVSIPMTLSAALLDNWVFGEFLCKFVNFTPTLTALISTFTVAVIAVERWLFIVNKKKFHRRHTILILILLWLVSILIALPEFISREIQQFMPKAILSYMMKNYPVFQSQLNNETDLKNNYDMIEQPCQMKTIVYCVLKPDIHMRIFSYTIMTVQYLVPFLFVSVSCYSISCFLKQRMKRMSIYQTSNHSTINSRKKSSNTTEEMIKQELLNNDDLKLTIINNNNNNNNKCNHFLFRFRQTFKNHERNSLPITDQQRYLKNQSHIKRRFHRSRKLLICVAALFTISWLPLTIVQIYLEHNQERLYTRDGANFVYGYLLIPCYLISSLSAWINPVIYNYINRSFRREFYALYPCCFRFSSNYTRKETVSIQLKRNRDEIDIYPLAKSRLTTKRENQFVSFADQPKIMHHK